MVSAFRSAVSDDLEKVGGLVFKKACVKQALFYLTTDFSFT